MLLRMFTAVLNISLTGTIAVGCLVLARLALLKANAEPGILMKLVEEQTFLCLWRID